MDSITFGEITNLSLFPKTPLELKVKDSRISHEQDVEKNI